MATTLVNKIAGGAGGSAFTDVISSTQAVDATSVDGLLLATSQTATAGNQKYSPALHFTGSGWKTDTTAGAQACDWRVETQPIQGSANPLPTLVVSSSVNGGAYAANTAFTQSGIQLFNSGGIRSSTTLANYAAGIHTFQLLSSSLFTVSGFNISWASSATSSITGIDTNLSRISAGVVGVGTGAAGSFAGTLKCAYVNGVATVDATTVDGLKLETSQTASAGNTKYSPAIHLKGSGWKTDATAAADGCNWYIESRPKESTSRPENRFVVSASTDTAESTITPYFMLVRDAGTEVKGVLMGSGASVTLRLSASMTSFDNGNYVIDMGSNGITEQTSNAAKWIQGHVSELVTIAAAASTDTTIDLPANSVIESVVVRVTTVIPTATSFSVGDPTTAARFGTGISTAANTTAVCIDHWSGAVSTLAAGPSQASAAKVRLTMAGGTPAANTGRVRVTIFYRQFVAPTS